MFRSLGGKIIFSFCVLMVAGGAVSTTLVSRNMSRSLGAIVDRTGSALAHMLADQLQEPLAYRDRLTVRAALSGARDSNPDVVYAFVTDARGSVRDHSFPLGRFPQDLLAVASSAVPRTIATERGSVRDIPFPVADGVLGVLHVGLAMTWVDEVTAAAVGNVLLTTLMAMAAGVLGILFLATLITRPVSQLRDAATRLGGGEVDVLAPVVGRDEIADLATAFNRMAAQIRERIEESDAWRRYVERVLDHMDSSIVVLSPDRRVEYANRIARERHGPLEGTFCSTELARERPCDDCPVTDVLRDDEPMERRFEAPSGRVYDLKWVPIEGRDGVTAVMESARDVTERVQTERRLQRTQRLAVAGELSAGIVHAVNNPLDGVRRAIELARAHSEEPERVERMLDLADEGTGRIAAITRTLLGFARGDSEPDPVPVRVVSLVESAERVARLRADSHGVSLTVRVDADVGEVTVDPQAMEEVLVNLLMNAIDASQGEGRVEMTASRSSDEVRMSVRDTGTGVAEGLEARIFEPFFTTKDGANGTGLGLAVARRVVEAHGGTVSFIPREGGGAEFVVSLPLESTTVEVGRG
jgi:signal transduction histidine kinase